MSIGKFNAGGSSAVKNIPSIERGLGVEGVEIPPVALPYLPTTRRCYCNYPKLHTIYCFVVSNKPASKFVKQRFPNKGGGIDK